MVLLGALPALVAMMVFDRLDAKRPEPRATLRRAAILGGVSVLPCILVELVLMKIGPQTGYAAAIWKGFVVAAAVEELAKLVVMRFFIWNRPEFDERMDGITYAVRAGLGFALVGNIGYLLGQKGVATFVIVYLLRALLAVPGHAVYAGVTGYFAARRRFDGTGPGIFGGYLLAVLLHGAYDSAIFSALIAHQRHDEGLVVMLLPIPLFIIVAGAFAMRTMITLATRADDRAGVPIGPRPY